MPRTQEELRRLLYYFIDTVIERPSETPLPVFPMEILTPLAISLPT